jgi:hypothetical protein
MLNRFFVALFIFVVGVDLIWFGCQQTGADSPNNPAWQLIDGLVTIEKYGIILVFCVILIVGIIFFVTESKRPEPDKSEYEIVKENRIQYQNEVAERKARSDARIMEAQAAERRAKNKLLGIDENPIPVYVRPQKPKLTPDELKKKAIQDILGR